MDALAVVLYFAQSMRHDKIPFISDIHAFSTVVNTLSAGGYSALVGFRYSVSLFPLVLSFTGVMNVWLNGFLFILSEFLKIYSLWIYKYEGERPPVKE